MLDEIFNKLEIINRNVESNNYFLEDYPKFLDDLEYILIQLSNDYKQLSIGIQFQNSDIISELVTSFYTKLITKYMKVFQGMDIQIKTDNTATMFGGLGGYLEEDDCIYISELFSSFRIPTLQTICHEIGHKRQKNIGCIKSFDELLKYPHYMIILLKERLSEKLLERSDHNFYKKNYNLMYHEQEANTYSLEVIKNLLVNTYKNYLEYAKKNNIKVSKDLLNQLRKIQKKINDELLETKEKFKQKGQFNIDLINEFSGYNSINSKVMLNGKEVDRLILYDKCIKKNPNLQQEYPILQLLFKDDKPKSYQEIVIDLQKWLKLYPNEQNKIKRIYYSIIKSDPMLYISHLVQSGNISLLRNFITNHETVLEEYNDEISKIIKECDNDFMIELFNKKVK